MAKTQKRHEKREAMGSDVARRRAGPFKGIKIVDPVSGATQPPGELGEICVRGYQVMQGY